MNSLYEIDDSYYYVYEHWLDDEVIYVGKGAKGRAFNSSRNSHWREKVNGREDEVKVVIKGYFKSEEDAFNFEEMTIIELVQKGVDLTNVTHNEKRSLYYHSRYKLSLQRRITEYLKSPFNPSSNFELNEGNIPNVIKIKHMNQILSLIFDSEGKVIIFSKQKTSIIRALQDKGCKVLNVPFNNNNVANVSTHELNSYKELLDTGSIPNPYDIVVLPPYGMGNMKITDSEVDMVIVDTINEDEYKHSISSINVELSTLIYKDTSGNVCGSVYYFNFPAEMLNINLDTKTKSKLSERLSICDYNNRRVKWSTIKKSLRSQGYLVEDKTIREDGKQKRISIVSIDK